MGQLSCDRMFRAGFALAVLALGAARTASAMDTYDPVTHQLTIGVVTVGNAQLENVVATVASIVTLPSGGFPNGSADSYDPASRQLTVPGVDVNSSVYYNAVVTLAPGPVTIGSASGVDSYANDQLTLQGIAVGNTLYSGVVLNVGVSDVIKVEGGMPASATDSYAGGVLTLPVVTAFGHVYTNVSLHASPSEVAYIGSETPTGGAYTITATISGLQTGQSVQILNDCGDAIVAKANGPQTFATPLKAKSIYAVTVGTQPRTQACTVLNGTGGIVSSNVTNVQVNCSTTEVNYYAYVANSGDNSISGYTVDSTTGELTPLSGSPFSAAGTLPVAMTVNAAGTVAYTANLTANTVSGYTVNVNNGSLSLGVPFATGGDDPYQIAIDPTGQYAYVANYGLFFASTGLVGNNVTAFSIDRGTGALAPIAQSPYLAGTTPQAIMVDATGKFVYVADDEPVGGALIYAFAMDLDTGALTPVAGSPFAAGGISPWAIAADPTGNYIYVANAGGTNISAFSYDPGTGELTAVEGSPFAAGGGPVSISIDPDGIFLYAVNQGSANVSAYTINATTGTLTPVAGSPFATNTGPTGADPILVKVDPTGRFVYVPDTGNNVVWAYTIDRSSGALTPMSGSPFAAGPHADSIWISKVVLTGSGSGGNVCTGGTSGTFTAAPPLGTAVYSQSATLLASGNVLVAGGNEGTGFSANAQLYDPVAHVWLATGSLGTARAGQTATLLLNGKVLVAGGASLPFGAPITSAELYDPVAGTWSATGSMTISREGHAATLLPNGKVLVAGGYNGNWLASSELYDPATGTWTATGSMSAVRNGLTATLLPNGQVLASGGQGAAGNDIVPLNSAELYDPVSGTWTATGSLATAREFHAATLLNNGTVLLSGGQTSGGILTNTAELYDPASGNWSTTAAMATYRQNHTSTLLPSGQVLVAGGFWYSAVADAETYDPVAATWTVKGPLATARYVHTATLLPYGTVLITGGRDSNDSPIADSEMYWP